MQQRQLWLLLVEAMLPSYLKAGFHERAYFCQSGKELRLRNEDSHITNGMYKQHAREITTSIHHRAHACSVSAAERRMMVSETYQLNGSMSPSWNTDEDNHVDNCGKTHWKCSKEKALGGMANHGSPYLWIYTVPYN